MAKRKLPPNLAEWVSARRRYRLTHAQVQMARELGMNPGKLGSLANHEQEPWKAPLPQFIEGLYEKRFGRSAPENVRSFEEVARARDEKRSARKAAKRRQQQVDAERRVGADRVGWRREIGSVPAAALPGVPSDLPVMEPPSTRLSDALLDIVAPHVPWPPAPDDLDYARASIALGGDVWNASRSRDPREREEALARLAQAHARALGVPVDEVLELVRAMSARKLELHASDLRYVAGVDVRVVDDRILIDVASAYRRP